MRDEPRADAKAGLQRLKDAGIKVVMLTGDNKRTADAIGKQLGIDVRAVDRRGRRGLTQFWCSWC